MATAFPGPYVDTSITQRDVTGQSVPTPLPARAGSTPKPTTVYDPPGTDHDPGDQGATPPAHKPFWAPGQDPYKNDGMPDQEFLENAG